DRRDCRPARAFADECGRTRSRCDIAADDGHGGRDRRRQPVRRGRIDHRRPRRRARAGLPEPALRHPSGECSLPAADPGPDHPLDPRCLPATSEDVMAGDGKIFLADCTLPAVEAHLRESAKIVVPVGATEQHGPHAPFGTDAILSTEASVRLARRVGALVAPAVPYGVSGDHRGYAGVPFLSASTMTAVVQDVVVSLAEGGFREVILVNGHYTN